MKHGGAKFRIFYSSQAGPVPPLWEFCSDEKTSEVVYLLFPLQCSAAGLLWFEIYIYIYIHTSGEMYVQACIYLLACQVRVTVGDDSGNCCCCVCVTSFEHWLTPLFVDSAYELFRFGKPSRPLFRSLRVFCLSASLIKLYTPIVFRTYAQLIKNISLPTHVYTDLFFSYVLTGSRRHQEVSRAHA